MDAFPVTFHTILPSKFCVPGEGEDYTPEQILKRNRKLVAANDQTVPRSRLEEEGWGVPQDVYPPLTVYDNNSTAVPVDLRRKSAIDAYGGSTGVGDGGILY